MFLFIARHAWAGEYGDPRWPDDSLRELTPDGIERYTKVVQALADRGFNPDCIATSPYIRCRQTADIIAKYTANKPSIDELAALACGSEIELLLEWSREHSRNKENSCGVGRFPEVEQHTGELIGDGAASMRFAKGAVAAIDFEDEIAVGAGKLYWLVTAKLLSL